MKKALYCFGSALGLLGLAFVVFKLHEYAAQIDLSKFSVGMWVALLFLILVYGVAGVALAIAWRNILRFLGLDVNLRWAVSVYGNSQLAKYVPSNIFQFAGRQVLGAAAGLPAAPLLKSVFWELASLASAGVLFAVLTFPVLLPRISIWGALLLYAAGFAVAVWLIRRLFGTALLAAWVWYSGFLALAGFSFVIVLGLVTGNTWGETAFLICGAFLLAWLVGLLTPGAPAGVGVREVVLYALLQNYVSEVDLVTAIVLGRVVTVSGDVVFYLLAAATRPGLALNTERA